MSTHNLDVSGARALTTRTNDPVSTYASTPAKQGDDVSVQISGGTEFRFELPASARLQRRRYPQQQLVKVDGKPVADPDKPGHYLYEATEPIDRLVLVLPGGISAGFLRCSQELLPEDERRGPTFESYPHTTISARRWKEAHFTESGELVEEIAISDASEAWEDSIERIVAALRREDES